MATQEIVIPVWMAGAVGSAIVAQALAAIAWGVRLQQRMILTERQLTELEAETAITTTALGGVRDRLMAIETDVKWIRRSLEHGGKTDG